MKLPSKTTPYKNSVIALFPKILALLKEKNMSVANVYHALDGEDIGDFIGALDCLYALGSIEIDPERRMLRFVDTNTL